MIKTMLEKLHQHHFGAASSIRMARDVFFWPGMRGHIDDMCKSCAECAKYGKEAPKEPMKSLPVPTLPWQIVSQDIFDLEGKNYLVTVCHFSDWIELDELKANDSNTVIKCTKAHFARYGVPQICHTDNGPQFISNEYHNKFATTFGFKHTRSSPYHSKGNGRAEAAVKVSKDMMKKAKDVQAALLNYRNTPQQGHTYSPAQRMFNHRTRSMLPTSNKLLAPELIDTDKVSKEIMQKRVKAKEIYDRDAGNELPAIGQVITTDHGNRSYSVQTPVSVVRRNRTQLRPAAAPSHPIRPIIVRPTPVFEGQRPGPSDEPELPQATVEKPQVLMNPVQTERPVQVNVESTTGGSSPSATATAGDRPSRNRQMPVRFGDYDMS